MFADHPLIKPFTQLEPDYFPQTELEEAISQQETITPLLLMALGDFVVNPEDYDILEGNYLPAVSLALLAQFRESSALPAFLGILRGYDQDEFIYGDLIYSIDMEFGRILASLCGGDIARLKSLVLDKKLEALVRTNALDALMTCYFEGDLAREDFVHFLSGLYTSFQSLDTHSEDYIALYGSLFKVSLTIHPGDLMDEIREMCKDDVPAPVEDFTSDLEFAESMASKDFDQWLADEWQTHVEDYGYINDAVRELQRWDMNIESEWDRVLEECSNEDSELRASLFEGIEAMERDLFDRAPVSPFTQNSGYLSGTVQPIIRDQPKIGRNDPCSCGSGKKFKKCCGQ